MGSYPSHLPRWAGGNDRYEIKDNKLWGRHTVTLVSQVAVALYAFYKSWPRSSDPKLLVATVLLFVVEVVSFSQKPWALKAKARRLAAVSSFGGLGIKKPSRWRERMNQFFFPLSNCFTGTGGEEEGCRGPVILTEADRLLNGACRHVSASCCQGPGSTKQSWQGGGCCATSGHR